ncbi:MAG: hypothetical protein PVH39_03120, partial [Syntrophobacterales bacterium]
LVIIIYDGSHIHNNSLLRVMSPHLLINPVIPMGETRIGRQGKKYLVSSNGDRRAMPRPPLVKASRMP